MSVPLFGIAGGKVESSLGVMRQSRLKAPENWKVAYYHCVSRVVDRRLAFDEEDKRQFVKFMRFYERVSQVRVVSYCVMSNHFHILVEVPAKPAVALSEEALIAHIQRCYGKDRSWFVAEEIKQWRSRGVEKEAQKIIDRWRQRMWEVSSFMKTLKQRFTQWHNKRHVRKGTLWEDRFHSTIVQGGGGCHALAMVGAYIDLNPIRAAMVDDPKDYLWSGYGAALGGDKAAIAGIEAMVAHLEKSPKGTQALEVYRMAIYGEMDGGDNPPQSAPSAASSSARRGVSSAAVVKVRQEGGRLSRREMLRCRVRYFTTGAVVGNREFVEEVFQCRRERFGTKREDGARLMRGADFGGLCSLRDLRLQPLG